MTNKEQIEKLERTIEECFTAFKMLSDLEGCRNCNELNKELIDNIFMQINRCVQMKKEIK
jgi:hypothetical protein